MEIIVKDLDCKYRWSEELNQLEYCILGEDDWAPVEEDLVGEEEVMFNNKLVTLSEVYRIVEGELDVVRS